VLPPPPGAASMTITDYRLAFVDVTVSGHSARALLDTGGATGVQVSSTLVREVGLHTQASAGQRQRLDGSTRPRLFGVLSTFEVAGFRQQDGEFELVEGDVERIAQQVGTPFDVILGWGYLSQHRTVFDVPAGLLELHALDPTRPDGPAPVTAQGSDVTLVLPYADTAGVPVVDAQIGETPVRFVVDTGAPFSTLDPAFARTLAPPSGREKLAYRGQQVPLDVYEVAFGEQRRAVRFLAKDLSALKATGASGVLGNTLLLAHRVTFDPAQHTVEIAGAREQGTGTNGALL